MNSCIIRISKKIIIGVIMLYVPPVLTCNEYTPELENNPVDVDPALFQHMTSMHFFPQTNPDGNVCLLRPSRDSTLPKLTSNTKQQLLFHGCVQAENRSSALGYRPAGCVCSVLQCASSLVLLTFCFPLSIKSSFHIFALIAVKFTHSITSVISE